MGPKRKRSEEPGNETASSSRRTTISADDAIQDILRFVDDSDSDSDDNNLSDLIGNVSEDEEESANYSDDGDNQAVDERANRLRRKKLTKNRLVNSIDSALDLDNYNAFVLPEQEKSMSGTIRIDNNRNNHEKIDFKNKPNDDPRGRQNRANVITGSIGLRTKAKNVHTEREAFELFICPDMLDSVINHTNVKINKLIDKLPNDFNKDYKLSLCSRNRRH